MRVSGVHLCQGRHLQHHGESPYAAARRYLIANPGLSLGAIESELQKRYPSTEKLSRYAQHEGRAPNSLTDGALARSTVPSKHCPECASSLFHSNLFEANWLSRCPLHGRRLSSFCPKCHQPWPALTEIEGRSCPLCGVITAQQWQNRFPRSSDLDTSAFVSLEQVLARTIPGGAVTIDNAGNFSYGFNADRLVWRPSTWKDTPFLAQMLYIDNPHDSAGHFEQITGALYVPPYEALLEDTETDWQTIRFGDQYLDRVQFSIDYIKADYEVLVEILSRVPACVTEDHRVIPYPLSYVAARNLGRMPPLCPFCMALRAWLEHVVKGKLDYWPFDRSRGAVRFADFRFDPPTVPYLFTLRQRFFRDCYAIELYKRSLKALFVDMHRSYVLARHDRNATSEETRRNPAESREDNAASGEEWHYSCFMQEGNAKIFFSLENPLDSLRSQPDEYAFCSEFNHQLPNVKENAGQAKFHAIDESIDLPAFMRLVGNQFKCWGIPALCLGRLPAEIREAAGHAQF